MSEKKVIPKKTMVSKPVVVTRKVIAAPPKPIKENMEADAPENPQVSGWKKKIEEKEQLLAPKILKTKSDTWDTKITQNREKRKKGLVIFVYAMSKVGKTHFGLTASDFEGYEGNKRILPKGYPVFALDTENSVEDESEIKFEENLFNNKIVIENCFVENDITKEVDPTKSLDKMEEWAYSLANVEDGTLMIDTFTDYCEYAYYKLVDKVLGIGFTQDGKENKTPMPMQYKWRTKKVVSFLRTLRNFKMNVILTAQGKEETETGDKGPMDYHKTGKVIADALDKSAFWVDVICVLDKEVDAAGNVTRRLVVTDCRFETADMLNREYVLENENINVTNLIGLFKDLM
jgi:hypothetical protein